MTPTTKTTDTCNILSLDGGGLRGLVTAVFLERLEYSCPGFLASVDLVVGTSTGGILALALAKGLTPYTIMRMYLDKGGVIFNRSPWRRLASFFGLTRAKYDNDGLRTVLGEVFGDCTLGDLSKRVVVTAFELDDKDTTGRSWKPKIFHNCSGVDSDCNERVVDVALYTSAAPTYFPSVDGFIDGGVFANNPSVVGLAQALDCRNEGAGGVSTVDKIRLLSVGTGANLSHVEGDRLDWGVTEWAKPLLDILLDGVSEVADFQCGEILRDRYQRLQLDFPSGVTIPMDSVSALDRLLQMAQVAPVVDTVRWLSKCGWVR